MSYDVLYGLLSAACHDMLQDDHCSDVRYLMKAIAFSLSGALNDMASTGSYPSLSGKNEHAFPSVSLQPFLNTGQSFIYIPTVALPRFSVLQV